MAKWEPIETAPKDGMWQVVGAFRDGELVWWSKSRFKNGHWRTNNGGTVQATHWLPFPVHL